MTELINEPGWFAVRLRPAWVERRRSIHLMPAEGHLVKPVLNPRAIAALAYTAGFTDIHDLTTAVAVSFAECDGYIASYNDNLDDHGNVESRDVGAWQINIPADQIGTAHETALLDPATNAAAAFKLWTERGWQPWSSYASGICFDDTYVMRALLGVMNYAAVRLTAEQAMRPARQTHHTLAVPLVSTSQLHHLYPAVPLG